jgi:hypothetical protein
MKREGKRNKSKKIDAVLFLGQARVGLVVRTPSMVEIASCQEVMHFQGQTSFSIVGFTSRNMEYISSLLSPLELSVLMC